MTVCGYLVAKECHQMAVCMNMETLFFFYLNSQTDKNKILQIKVIDPMALVEVCALLVLLGTFYIRSVTLEFKIRTLQVAYIGGEVIMIHEESTRVTNDFTTSSSR